MRRQPPDGGAPQSVFTWPKLMTHHGSVDGAVFLHFVRRRLAPWLHRSDVVVMDSLNIHKRRAAREAIEAVGATPIYLPTYSPELNPIEPWWADMKRFLRKLAINLAPDLRSAFRRLCAQVPLTKISAWFRRALTWLKRSDFGVS